MAPTGVALLQMGGPRTPPDVEAFLARLFADPDIIRLPTPLGPFQPALARKIARARAPGVREKYVRTATPDRDAGAPCPEDLVVRSTAKASPLAATTERLAGLVEKELANRGAWRPVTACFRYVEPSGPSAVEALSRAGAADVLGLTLYPHWSGTTTGSSWSDLRAAARGRGLGARLVDRWGLHAGYLALAAADAQAALDRVPEGRRGRVHLLFSAHGIPESYARAGDPYPDEVRRSAAALAARLHGFDTWSLAFQSAVGPVRWLRPYTDSFVRENGGSWSALVVVPLGFVSDHIETLWDADVLVREAAREAGVPFYARAAMFNDRPAFASLVADLVQEAGA